MSLGSDFGPSSEAALIAKALRDRSPKPTPYIHPTDRRLLRQARIRELEVELGHARDDAEALMRQIAREVEA